MIYAWQRRCIEGKSVEWIVLGFLLVRLLLEFLWLLSIDSELEAIEQGHYQEQQRLELLRRNAAERNPKTGLKHTFPLVTFCVPCTAELGDEL